MITPSFSLTATERVLPKLALDFTTANLDSRITFTRSGSTATRVNSSGYIEAVAADTPRFDYNPTTLVCNGLLIEEQRKNLQPQGSNMALWTGSDVTLTGSQTAPNNTSEAALVSESATTAPHYFYYTGVSVTSGQNYANTVYVKNQTNTQWIQIALSSSTFGTNAWANFNVVNGVVGNKGSAVVTHSISDAGNGWWRCNIVAPASATATGAAIQIAFTNNTDTTSRLLSYLGTGKQFLAWGAQTEQGVFPTSYIPTDGTVGGVTRNADVATMTGTNFSSWFNASEGTFEVWADRLGSPTAGTNMLLQMVTGSDNVSMFRSNSTATLRMFGATGGVTQVNLTNLGTISNTTQNKYSFALKTNNLAAAYNSTLAGTDTSCTFASYASLNLGNEAGASQWNGHFAYLAYYPQRLINAELQAITK